MRPQLSDFFSVTSDREKDDSSNFRKNFKDRYETANGSDSFDNYLEVYRTYISEVWSELLFYRADLSSK